jgi:hypothetical protein
MQVSYFSQILKHTIPSSYWKAHKLAVQFRELPCDAALSAVTTNAFDFPNYPLSKFDDTITGE